jgi:hypothetical protein
VTPSADRCELPLPTLCGSLDDPLGGPVVDPQSFGGGVDGRAVTACSQHCDHGLDGLCCRAGCNQLGRKVCIDVCGFYFDLCRLGLR